MNMRHPHPNPISQPNIPAKHLPTEPMKHLPQSMKHQHRSMKPQPRTMKQKHQNTIHMKHQHPVMKHQPQSMRVMSQKLMKPRHQPLVMKHQKPTPHMKQLKLNMTATPQKRQQQLMVTNQKPLHQKHQHMRHQKRTVDTGMNLSKKIVHQEDTTQHLQMQTLKQQVPIFRNEYLVHTTLKLNHELQERELNMPSLGSRNRNKVCNHFLTKLSSCFLGGGYEAENAGYGQGFDPYSY